MTSTEQINSLIVNGNTWLARANALAADREGHENAYAALSGNLKGVVNGQMFFTANVDPDEANPTLVDGGTFTHIHEVAAAAPLGAFVSINLLPGKTYPLDDLNVSWRNRSVVFNKAGSGSNPVISPVPFDDGSTNSFYFFTSNAGLVVFNAVDIKFPAKSNPALPWGRNSLFAYTGRQTNVAIQGAVVSGPDGGAICSAHIATIVGLSLNGVTLDGPVFAVNNVAQGVVSLASLSITLTNGAALNDGGTVGVNILKN